MNPRHRYAVCAIAIATLLLQAGCSDPAEPESGGLGAIRISTTTHGLAGDLDPDGYGVQSSSGSHSLSVPVNGEAFLEGLPSGDHTLTLEDLASNCRLNTEPTHTVWVIPHDTVDTGWIVTCSYRPAKLVVSFVTPPDAAAGELTVTLGDRPAAILRPGGSIEFDSLGVGGHNLSIGLTPNCRIEGPIRRHMVIGSAEQLSLQLRGACTGGRLIFNSADRRLWRVTADGSAFTEVAIPADLVAVAPAGSLDGERLAFAFGYGMYVMSIPGAATRILELEYGQGDFSWSPDDTRIAFVRIVADGGIYVVNADGSGLQQVISTPGGGVGGGLEPSWSPAGDELTFESFMTFPYDWILKVRVDGTGLVPLAPGKKPRWSPDGTRIAFVSPAGDLSLMNPDGTDVRTINNAPRYAQSLTWSPDARLIAFYVYGAGIMMVDPDGRVIRMPTADIPLEFPEL